MNTCFNINNYRICGGLLFLAACLLLLACGTQSRNKSEGTSDLVIKKNYGITTQPQKFQIPVSVTTSNQYLLIENPHINEIKVSDQTNSVIWKTGDHFPFESRPIENRFFVFPIGASTVADTLNLVLDKTGENLSFVLRLLDEKSYTHFLKVDNYLIGGIIGFYGLAILLSFTLFLFNRSYKFFFFLTYVFFSVWWILNDAGILFANWWPTSTVWHQSSRGFFSSLTMVLFGLFLYQHSNALLGKGIKVVVKVLLVFYSAKWLLSFFVAAGYFPASLKLVTMYINSICLLLLFGGVIVYLLKHREALRKNKFEVFSIVTYCVFVIMLALRELGVSFLVFKTLHQLEVLFFFPVQCLFMSAHLYLTTKEERKAVEADLLQLKVQQQRTIEETVAQVEASEKKRIAQDLHDEIGGIFVALKYQSLLCKQRIKDGVTAADFNYFIELADEGIKRQHRIINELQTTLEQPSGLFNSLRNQISLLTKSSDLKIKFDFKANESHWPPFLKAQLYRIILELLTNTIKHAGATSVTLAIIENAQIQIVFSDNGVGFVHHKDLPGNGINNIKQRINALKGQYELVSNSKGTQYFITIPLANV
jgi:signal transduction histidine kinase